jgi:hypothetical protein
MNRRSICLLILGTCLAACLGKEMASAQPAPNEAEKLFRQIKEACLQAKTTDITFEGSFTGNLPLKRVISAKQETVAMTLTEAYTKLAMDAKVDPSRFELPK